MRYYKSFFDKVKAGNFFGEGRTNGRVTVEPLWLFNATSAAYGNSVRGPYHWFQDTTDSGVEWEIPNVKNIKWDRSADQDIASCTITISNTWHEGNEEDQELEGQLGKPGYFWPKRGIDSNRWNQLEAKGAFRKDGFWDPNFSWQNVLERYALIRTYQGFGGNSTEDEYKSVQDNIDNEDVLITGTWLVDYPSAGSNGELILNCKDMGKILLEQTCFPPTIPEGIYPVDYYPAGKSAFDSVFGPRPKTGVSPASEGEVKATYADSSVDHASGESNTSIDGHLPSHSNDGNWGTYSLSEAYATPSVGAPWFEFQIDQPISKLSLKPWAGGYECYVSVHDGTDWLGTEDTPQDIFGLSVKYLKHIKLPMAIPDNQEPVTYIELSSDLHAEDVLATTKVRLTFTNLYYSGIDGGAGFYRAGIRDLIFYRMGDKVDPYTSDFGVIPWTFSMTSHPTRGYWVIDDGGNVYGFGDAADYDSTAFGAVPLAARSGHSDNQSIAMAAHPDGKGYWVLDRMGHVYAYGSAGFFGEYEVAWPGTDKWGMDGLAAWDIAPTYTGNGYWVIYGNGVIKGFGDAASITDIILPSSAVDTFMNTFVNNLWNIQHRGNAIAAHPSKIGFWACSGSGEVHAYGECVDYGSLDQRVYNRGMADQFRLAKTEFTKSIESTKTGNGYWIAFGSGHIAAFGDAVNQGPTYVYADANNPNVDIIVDPDLIQDYSFFRALVWDIARDPDGSGFWILVADGSVGSYNAEFWGQPSYDNLSGYRWHEGNFDGDYSQIMRELLLWAGWTFYNPSITSADPPEIFGAIESTGIKTDTFIEASKFDKRPILDVIKELCEVVAYNFNIQEDGSVKIASTNFWRAGNFDPDGSRIYVDEDGNRVDPEDPDAQVFIPTIDELDDLFDYNTSLLSEPMRSEIIIGNELPDPKNPSATKFVRHIPRSATEEVAPGIPLMRNIPRPAIWMSQLFANEEEMATMAELIAITAWFGERPGTVNCLPNPAISVDDQIKIYERNTSETNIHYVKGISSDHDLETGVWTYSLTTHWLGDENNWVITADEGYAPVGGYHYVEVSERIDRWQQSLGLGLEKGGLGNGAADWENIITLAGEFDRTTQSLGE